MHELRLMRMILTLLLLLNSRSVSSQDIVIQNKELLDYLETTKDRISTITHYNFYKNSIINIDNKQVKNKAQFLIKNGKGLFLLIDGTGQVYKISNQGSANLKFTRIDSTIFLGYNSNSIIFSYRDTLYSFGGSGFWRRNGQLRYFSDINNEWNIQKINKEIPTLNTLYYLDLKDKSIVYLQTPFIDPATDKRFNNYIVTKLKLDEKKNLELGKLNKQLSNLFLESPEYIFISVPFLNGTLISFSPQNIFFLNYATNEVYKIAGGNVNEAINGNSTGVKVSNAFAIKDSIYYTKSIDTTYKLYSFPISMNDFVKEPYPLYEPFEDEKKSLYFYIGGLCILLIGGSVFFVKKRKQKTTSTSIEPTTTVFKKEDNGIDFNPLELELITKMIEQSARGNHFSVEDINTSLGLNRKTLEIQKKIRTETINRINHKFKIKYNLSIDLIERIRSEEDRRYYKYMISGENSKLIKN